jgi:putative cell wall-binding protein
MQVRTVVQVLAVVAVAAVAALVPQPPLAAEASITRLAGQDRHATAAEVSSAGFAPGVPVAYVATGATYPDALAGAPLAARTGGPILLVTRDALPRPAADELARLQPGRIVILGGTAAIGSGVAAELAGFTHGSVSRLAGDGRAQTAARLSMAGYDAGVPVVYIATGDGFADALAAGSVAGRPNGGPILLVTRDAVPASTAAELQRLAPRRIVIVGGRGAVSDAVEAALGAHAPTVERVAGADRFTTAVALSQAYFSGGAPTVYLATGADFPDALAGGAAAALAGAPLLLVRRDCLPPAVAAEVRRLEPAEIVLLGGPAALGPQVEAGVVCAGGSGSVPADNTAPRFRAVYAVPADVPVDPTLPAAMHHELDLANNWFAEQTPGRRPRFQRLPDGRLDIAVITMDTTRAALEQGDPHRIVERNLVTNGLRPDGVLVIAYVQAAPVGIGCGSERGGIAVLWLSNCSIQPAADTTAFPFGATFVAAHELVHAFGAVPDCAPNADGTGHVDDHRGDLLWRGQGSRDWAGMALDPGRDDYYEHGRSDCPDIATSPVWEPAP